MYKKASGEKMKSRAKTQGAVTAFLLCCALIFSATPVFAVSDNVIPDTGQTGDYTATFGEDSDYEFNPPSYTEPVPNLDGIITDNITGLVWQMQDDTAQYNWFEATGTADDTSNPGGVVNVCGALTLDGRTWRLPTIKELNQIADYGVSDPAINTTAFPNIKYGAGDAYWSATASGLIPTSAMNIHFDTATPRIDASDKTTENYVLCVSGTELTSDFVVLPSPATGIVSDNNMGLMWQQQDDNVLRTWEAAISYCEGLSLSGYSDWRLPNIKESQTIVDYSVANPSINSTIFPGTNSARYWSSTTDEAFTDNAWSQRFSDGYVLSPSKTTTMYTRCVRENQIDTTAPDTVIDSGPTQPTSTSTSATFEFHAVNTDTLLTETGATFQCKVDDTGIYSTYTSCNSTKTYTGLAAGSHTFYVKATDAVGNEDLAPATYAWTIDTTAPDLIVTALSAPPTAAAGASITVTDTTKNNGTKAVGASSTTTFYLSADNVLTPLTDPEIGGRTIISDDLEIGESSASGPSGTLVTIPGGTTAGSYYIIAKADGPNEIDETNETNNKKSVTIKIGADLTVTALSAPATGGVGATILVTDTTTNSGAGDAVASTTSFYLSKNTTLVVCQDPPQAGCDPQIGTRDVIALETGLSETKAGTSLAIPGGITPGAYYIIAKADGPGLVPETTETNNTKYVAIKIGPDLTVTALTAPAIGGAGDTINVTDTTTNSGQGNAAASTTNFYLSSNATLVVCTDAPTNTVPAGCDPQIGSRGVGPLDSAGSSNSAPLGTDLTIPGGTAAGSYYIIAKADGPGFIIETSETNNIKTAAIKIGPDLTVTALTVPATGGPGADIIVSDTTKNSGGGDAIATATKFYLSTNTSFGGDSLLGSRDVIALAAGAEQTVSTTLTIPLGTAPGTYYIIAKTDVPDVNDETTETNNTKTSTSIKIGSDLTVSALKVLPTTAAVGESVDVTDTTKNSGGDAVASRTNFYLSTKNVLDGTTEVLLGGRDVPALAPTAIHSATTPLTIPATTAGAYFIIAKADDPGLIGETNENNNTKYVSIKIGGDLTVTALTVPTTAAAGGTISVNDTTKNIGAGEVAASKTKFYLSTDSVLNLSAGDILLAPTLGRSVPLLAAGGISSGTTLVSIPAGQATGSYYIIAKADPAGLVPETNEANNTKAVAIKIGPDLTVTVLTVPSTGGGEGASISVSNTVVNSGGASVDVETTVGFYLSDNAVLDGGDILLGTRAVGALAPAGINNASTTLTIPPGQGTGSYYLIAKADDGGLITETSETNNTKYAAIKIGPDLTVSLFTGPTTATAGVAFEVNDTIKNSGGGTAGGSTTRFYQSANSVWDVSDTEIGSRAVGGLATQEPNGPVATSVTISSAGTYYIIAKADADGAVTETLETNNTKYIRVVVSAP